MVERGEIDRTFSELKRAIGPQMVGWSNKIRDGKIRVYVSEMPTSSAMIGEVEIAGESYQVEYYRVGELRIL